jgi:hypothetical protein
VLLPPHGSHGYHNSAQITFWQTLVDKFEGMGPNLIQKLSFKGNVDASNAADLLHVLDMGPKNTIAFTW